MQRGREEHFLLSLASFATAWLLGLDRELLAELLEFLLDDAELAMSFHQSFIHAIGFAIRAAHSVYQIFVKPTKVSDAMCLEGTWTLLVWVVLVVFEKRQIYVIVMRVLHVAELEPVVVQLSHFFFERFTPLCNVGSCGGIHLL